jgi:EmrB/QacA subfamily drug resistance transporter
MEASTAVEQKKPLGRDVTLALAAMALAVFVVSNDITALTVAVPAMERDFDTNVGTVQWVINAYSLIFGVLIVTGGRLGDIFGHRRAFFTGIGIFVCFSLIGAFAQDAWWLIACRALMAIGGALMWPAIVGLIFSIVPSDRSGLAGGLILGVSGIGNAFGPMIGGLLTDAIGWQAILVLNLPVAAIAVAVTLKTVASDTPTGPREKLDIPGVITITLALVALLVALDQVSDWGWGDPVIIGLLVMSVALALAFVATQRRRDAAVLIPRGIVANPRFRAACLATLSASGIFFVSLLYVPQFTQKVLDYNALESGVALLPMMICFAATSFIAGPLYNKTGPRPLLLSGAVLMPIGILLLSFVTDDSGYLALVPGLAMLGIAYGLFYSTLTNAAITTLDSTQTGVGGGILYMSQLVGGTVGLALTTTVVLANDLQTGFRVDVLLGVLGVVAAFFVVRARASAGGAPAASPPGAGGTHST